MRPTMRALCGAAVFVVALVSCGDDKPGATPASGEDAGPLTTPPDDGGGDGGGGDASPIKAALDPTSRSGSRLRLRYLDAGGGAIRVIEFWDKELAMACTFAVAADGDLHCIPTHFGEVFYVGNCGSSQLALLTGADYCDDEFGKTNGRPTIFRRTATAIPAAGNTFHYTNDNGVGCSQLALGDASWLAVTEVPSSSFVAGKIVDEPRSGGLFARYVEGADGSRMLVSVHDSARGTACDFGFDGDRCVPAARGTLDTFADATCTTPVGSARGAPAVLTSTTRSGGCTTNVEHFAVGAEVIAPAPLYERNAGGTCVAKARSSSTTYYLRGALLALPAIASAREGTGPLQVRRRLDADGKPLGAAHTFWELAADRECSSGRIGDGATYRCIPTGSPRISVNEFSDATCSASPLAETSACAGVPPPFALRWAVRASCLGPDHLLYDEVRGRGSELTGSYFFKTFEGDCEARAPSASIKRWNLTEPIVASTLPAIELETE